MNQTEHLQRSPGDLAMFAVVFVGFVIAAAGLLTTSIPACVTGVLFMGVGFFYFIVKSFLFD